MSNVDSILAHYQESEAEKGIRKVFAAGDPLEIERLSFFHVGGVLASKQLAQMLRLAPGDQVLDVGSGLGGSARYLATTFDVSVLGIDLNEHYVTWASSIPSKAPKPRYEVASALAVPLQNESVDVVWIEHTQMNVQEKRKMLHECSRVLKPGGQLACNEIFRVGKREPQYPLPWASVPSSSFLCKWEDFVDIARDECLDLSTVVDNTAQSLKSIDSSLKLSQEQTSVRTLMGAEAEQKLLNLRDALASDLLTLRMGVFEKRLR